MVSSLETHRAVRGVWKAVEVQTVRWEQIGVLLLTLSRGCPMGMDGWDGDLEFEIDGGDWIREQRRLKKFEFGGAIWKKWKSKESANGYGPRSDTIGYFTFSCGPKTFVNFQFCPFFFSFPFSIHHYQPSSFHLKTVQSKGKMKFHAWWVGCMKA